MPLDFSPMPDYKLPSSTHDHSYYRTKGHTGKHACYCGLKWDDSGEDQCGEEASTTPVTEKSYGNFGLPRGSLWRPHSSRWQVARWWQAYLPPVNSLSRWLKGEVVAGWQQMEG